MDITPTSKQHKPPFFSPTVLYSTFHFQLQMCTSLETSFPPFAWTDVFETVAHNLKFFTFSLISLHKNLKPDSIHNIYHNGIAFLILTRILCSIAFYFIVFPLLTASAMIAFYTLLSHWHACRLISWVASWRGVNLYLACLGPWPSDGLQLHVLTTVPRGVS